MKSKIKIVSKNTIRIASECSWINADPPVRAVTQLTKMNRHININTNLFFNGFFMVVSLTRITGSPVHPLRPVGFPGGAACNRLVGIITSNYLYRVET